MATEPLAVAVSGLTAWRCMVAVEPPDAVSALSAFRTIDVTEPPAVAVRACILVLRRAMVAVDPDAAAVRGLTVCLVWVAVEPEDAVNDLSADRIIDAVALLAVAVRACTLVLTRAIVAVAADAVAVRAEAVVFARLIVAVELTAVAVSAWVKVVPAAAGRTAIVWVLQSSAAFRDQAFGVTDATVLLRVAVETFPFVVAPPEPPVAVSV